MSYHWYKFLHYFFFITFLAGMSATYIQKDKMKLIKIFYSAMALLTLVTGIMLSIRVGVQNYNTWPLWVKLKILLWGLLVVAMPIVNKFTSLGKWLFFIQIPILFFIIYAAVFKPM